MIFIQSFLIIFRLSKRNCFKKLFYMIRQTRVNPESLRDFYDEKISNNKALRKEMLLAVDVLYRTIGVGNFFDHDDSDDI